MSSAQDYYAVIGVDRDSKLQEIRTAFKQKVLTDHPDKGGDVKKFQLLNKAYNVLSDTDKRRRYDETGFVEKTAEAEFLETFGGGRRASDERSKDADSKAVVGLEERIVDDNEGPASDFAAWMRQRDQSEMVLTDKFFMKNVLFNAAELATQINHKEPVLHVLGSPKMDDDGHVVPGGAVVVESKARPLKKTLDHDEVLVRMLAVPVDYSMVFAELEAQSKVCLGTTGVGCVEQVGARIEDVKLGDTVLVLPKPTKFSSQRPIGTARTLLLCGEEDLFKVPAQIREELGPDLICLTPTIVCAYILLESFGAKLKAGDSVLLNAAHMSASGSALLQLCKLLKLKPICVVSLPGAPRILAKGEYGSKSSWEEAESRRMPPSASVRTQFEHVSEWLSSRGAEEIFPDAPALLRWRDRNQRMLPKLALDGVAAGDSSEQLMHCLQPGDKDAQLVVYGHGSGQSLEISPTLLAAWGGHLTGFNIARWAHALSDNPKQMMSIMENVTKLVRANKFSLETALCKVGQDSVSDAIARAADASSSAQVVLMFPNLEEELQISLQKQEEEKRQRAQQLEEEKRRNAEEAERKKLKQEWLSKLFTEGSVAAEASEEPLPCKLESGNQQNPSTVVVWIGDEPTEEADLLEELAGVDGQNTKAAFSFAWSEHPAGAGIIEPSVNDPQVLDASWFLRRSDDFSNEDLDRLHDVEVLGRCLVEALQPRLDEHGLTWRSVTIVASGKAAGVALYAALLRLTPQPAYALVLYNAFVFCPTFFGEKLQTLPRRPGRALQVSTTEVFTLWGSRDKSSSASYQQLLGKVLKSPDVKLTSEQVSGGQRSLAPEVVAAMKKAISSLR
eukprot:TRINITY_DN28371_c0_g1_i1.p1 TRINITY_DN28371_c0_g1~~TRINITY_DN28371_c0_g1_i1.p1  ORF type:complete len:866 (-),score=175.06 TRINITY_DN28371_c0_g1_i1:253-2787(-)